MHFGSNDLAVVQQVNSSSIHPNVCIWAKPNTKSPMGTSAISAALEHCELPEAHQKAARPVITMHSLL